MSKKQFLDSDNKTGYYGYRSESAGMSARGKSGKKRASASRGSALLGAFLAIIQMIASVAFTGLLIYKNLAFITMPVLTGIIVVLIILLAAVVFMQKKTAKTARGGKILSFFVIVILLVLIYLVSPLDKMSGKRVSTNPFVVFISANDTFGKLDDKTIGRSDTNIITVINPKTHNVLMISTPRDYYVPVQAKGVAPESYDKLTHVALYGNGIPYNSEGDLTAMDWRWAYEVKWHPGCQSVMDTLKYIYKFDVSEDNYHYVKLNFTGFAELIDALGGITIDVDIPFTTTTYASYTDKHNRGPRNYTYTEGEMEMDGDTALTFARERHSYADGDLQRNRNQVKVLKAMSNKLLSGSALLHYTDIIDAIENSFTTDMDISSMVSLQTHVAKNKDYKGWNIMSFSTIGTPARQICTYTGTSLSVVLQNEESIARASNLISMTLDGETTETIQAKIKEYNKEQGTK